MTDDMKDRIDHSLGRLPQGDFDVLAVLNWVYAALGMLAVGFIIYGAIQYALAHGDPAKAKKGKESIVYAVIGLVVVLLAAVITNFVYGVFGNA